MRCALRVAPAISEEDALFNDYVHGHVLARLGMERVEPNFRPLTDWTGRPHAEKVRCGLSTMRVTQHSTVAPARGSGTVCRDTLPREAAGWSAEE